MNWLRPALAAAILWVSVSAPAAAACRQALALALDVSGSVDALEYRLQIDGVANALRDPEVEAAFLMFPETPVRLMVFEWSARGHQRKVVPWTIVSSEDDLRRIADTLNRTQPAAVDDPSTAIGPAMLYGVAELMRQDDCWQKTLDISGDGPANVGIHPQDIKPEEIGPIIINGLIIGPDSPANINKNRHNLKSLLAYYESYILRGFGSFAEVAVDYADFQTAMRRKLIRELQPAAVSGVLPEGLANQGG